MADAGTQEEVDVDDILRLLKEQGGDDYLRLGVNKDIIHFLAQRKNADHLTIEKLRFSDACYYQDSRGKLHERHLVLSDFGVYHFLPGKYNEASREIPVRLIKGIIFSNKDDDMIMQVKDASDLRLSVVRKADVIRILHEIYHSFFGKDLPVRIGDNLDQYQVILGKSSRHKIAVSKGPVRAGHVKNGTLGRNEVASMGTSFRRKMSNEGVIAMQGWLTKEPGNSYVKAVWRQRYFRLSGSNLLYYEARLKGMITIDGGVARGWENKRVRQKEESKDSIEKAMKMKNVFRRVKETHSDKVALLLSSSVG